MNRNPLYDKPLVVIAVVVIVIAIAMLLGSCIPEESIQRTSDTARALRGMTYIGEIDGITMYEYENDDAICYVAYKTSSYGVGLSIDCNWR